jgi:class 3 adenylate cyclase
VARGAELVILFADVAGSTRLYEKLGDGRARMVVSGAVGVMSDVTRRHSGQVIKTIGDEVMSIFRSADQAADAAAEMQDAIGTSTARQEHPLAIRVGFHHGPAATPSTSPPMSRDRPSRDRSWSAAPHASACRIVGSPRRDRWRASA